MSNQNLLLLAIGLFATLVLTVAAVDQYLLDEHPPSEVSGLLWRVQNAYSHVRDLEAVLEFTQQDSETVRLLVRLVVGPPPVLSCRYLAPDSMNGETFTVETDQLSQYLPEDNLVIVKRWIGIPLASVALAGLGLTELEDAWHQGTVELTVLESVASTTEDIVRPPVDLPLTFTSTDCPSTLSFCPDVALGQIPWGFAGQLDDIASSNPILETTYVLEVRDAATGDLQEMVWIERDTFMIQKIVYYANGDRDRVMRVQRLTLDQGLTAEEVLALPRGTVLVRG